MIQQAGNLVPRIWRLLEREWRLLRSPFIPASLKSRAVRTDVLLRAQLRAQRHRRLYTNSGNGRVKARILDFEVTTFSLPTLAFLFEELFVNADYFFVPKKSAPFILDCGSNIGMSILFFKTLYPKAKIIGFEPEEATYALLEKNIASNSLQGVQVHQVALGMEDATVSFFVDPEQQGSVLMSTNRARLLSTGCPSPAKKEILVRQTKLSTFVDREVDLLKLDVEGAEDAVLQDLVSTGTIAKIDQMLVEYHHHIDKDKDAFSSFLGQLEKSGFGYQISTSYPISERASRGHVFQDVSVYAYRKY
jgi:FkbM family methyltransferase